MPPILEAPKKKQPFRIFEAGSGMLSKAIVKKAALSGKKGQNREFTGVDKNLLPRLSLLLSGRAKMPSTLVLKRADAIAEMAAVPAKSQSIVFSSYLLNNVNAEARKAFFSQAKRALRPGGRLAIVQDKSEVIGVRQDAKNLNWRTTILELADSALKKSSSKAMRERSTPAKRKSMLEYYLNRPGSKTKQAMKLQMETRLINSPDEYAKPVLIIMQKPRPPKNK